MSPANWWRVDDRARDDARLRQALESLGPRAGVVTEGPDAARAFAGELMARRRAQAAGQPDALDAILTGIRRRQARQRDGQGVGSNFGGFNPQDLGPFLGHAVQRQIPPTELDVPNLLYVEGEGDRAMTPRALLHLLFNLARREGEGP